MPVTCVTPEQWEKLTGECGSVYLGAPVKRSPDDLLTKPLSQVANGPRSQPNDDDDR
jgi:hypothetical protein